MYVAGSRSANAGSGLAPSVLALLTSNVGAAEAAGRVDQLARCSGVGDVAGEGMVRAAGQAGDWTAEGSAAPRASRTSVH